jgi:eukaryotic-like serine/threonine-protein kinase
MGIVYEAEQPSLTRRVALKVLPPASVLDDRLIARFKLESQAAAKLHHPNIVPVYNVGCDHGISFYSMPLIDCREHVFPMPAETVAKIGERVADALHHAHQEGVIHRDIKPSNLLIDQQGKIWVTDFGLARLQKGDDATKSGAIVGTMRYMSPEQACGNTHWVDHRTDIYALGVTLYEMLTGRCPFDSDDRTLFLSELERGQPTWPSRIVDRVPRDLETILLKAMAVLPQDRYATAADMAKDFKCFLAGEVISAKRPNIVDRISKWARRNRQWVTLGVITWGLFTVALMASGLALLRAERQTRLANRQSQTSMAEANTFFAQARH